MKHQETNMQRTAELVIVHTSPTCVSYRLLADGRTVWSNRVSPTTEADRGARERMAAWATQHEYRVVEPQPPREERQK